MEKYLVITQEYKNDDEYPYHYYNKKYTIYSDYEKALKVFEKAVRHFIAFPGFYQDNYPEEIKTKEDLDKAYNKHVRHYENNELWFKADWFIGSVIPEMELLIVEEVE